MEDNIFKRMMQVTKEISTVAKNLEVGTGTSKYKAVGEADILRAVKPIEEKYGVYSYPFDREIVESGTMERETKYGKSIQLYMRVKTTYRFVNTDDPSQFIDIVSYGDGVDPQDKACGKAMTYADKYALMKAYKIQTGDDPDQNASEEQAQVTAQQAQGNRISRQVMLDYVRQAYDAEGLKTVCSYYKISDVQYLKNDQLAVVYKAAMDKAAQHAGER